MAISKISVPQSVMDSSNPFDIDSAAFETTIAMMNFYPFGSIDPRIIEFYALSTYDTEVLNGGHSQLLYNLMVMDRMWVLSEARSGGLSIGALEFSDLAEQLMRWIRDNPAVASGQTGFEGGRAVALDVFDERYMDLDHVLADNYEVALKASADPSEAVLLDALSDGTGDISKIEALRILWLRRSGLLDPQSDGAHRDYIKSIGGHVR